MMASIKIKSTPKITAHEQPIYDLIFNEDDITWQSMLYELARGGKIDPWDIDITILTQEYLKALKNLKEMNFRLSGKFVLAAAILLKLKIDKLGMEQLLQLAEAAESGEYDGSVIDMEQPEDMLYEETTIKDKRFRKAAISPRVPGLRKRKVTLFELVSALKRAIDVDERRQQRVRDTDVEIPEVIRTVEKIDIIAKIETLYKRLRSLFARFKKKTITFENITPTKEKKDIIWTFVPLLHLANQGKIELSQSAHFGELRVTLGSGPIASDDGEQE